MATTWYRPLTVTRIHPSDGRSVGVPVVDDHPTPRDRPCLPPAVAAPRPPCDTGVHRNGAAIRGSHGADGRRPLTQIPAPGSLALARVAVSRCA